MFRRKDRKAEPFLQTPFTEGAQSFSPDGRWLAYVSDESDAPKCTCSRILDRAANGRSRRRQAAN
jgi:Tol biopolymer transport system component